MDKIRFLNVRQAEGVYADGIHDDTEALQHCFDQLRDGGTIYFPDGTYLLSAALIFYSHQKIKFSDHAVVIRSAVSQPITRYLLASYSEPDVPGFEGTHDVEISGGIFDGNAEVKEPITIMNTVHCRNIIIDSCRFRHGCIWHYIEINGSKDVLIKNCVFDGHSYTVAPSNLCNEMIQYDHSIKGSYGPVYDYRGELIDFLSDGCRCEDVVVENCLFKCNGFPGIGHHNPTAHRNITIRNNVFDGPSGKDGGSRGYIIFMKEVRDVFVKDNAFISTIEEGLPAHALVINCPDEDACIVENNTFIGNFSERFVGGVMEKDNIFLP